MEHRQRRASPRTAAAGRPGWWRRARGRRRRPRPLHRRPPRPRSPPRRRPRQAAAGRRIQTPGRLSPAGWCHRRSLPRPNAAHVDHYDLSGERVSTPGTRRKSPADRQPIRACAPKPSDPVGPHDPAVAPPVDADLRNALCDWTSWPCWSRPAPGDRRAPDRRHQRDATPAPAWRIRPAGASGGSRSRRSPRSPARRRCRHRGWRETPGSTTRTRASRRRASRPRRARQPPALWPDLPAH